MNKFKNSLAILGICIFFTYCSKDEQLSPEALSAKELISVSAIEDVVYTEIDNINKEVLIIIPYNYDLNVDKVPLSIKISPNATSNIISGEEYDLTQPFNLEITAKDNSKVNYTITAQKCNGDKVAVILSDTQIDIIPLYRQEAFFVNVNKVLHAASDAGVPIYYIMLESLKGTNAWYLPGQLEYQAGEYVDKPDIYDAFEVSSFHIDLLKKGIGTVYVMGVSSMGCVKGTCYGAIKNYFNLYLVRNAHSEPIGFRQESSIEYCNSVFGNMSGATLIFAADVSFN